MRSFSLERPYSLISSCGANVVFLGDIFEFNENIEYSIRLKSTTKIEQFINICQSILRFMWNNT